MSEKEPNTEEKADSEETVDEEKASNLTFDQRLQLLQLERQIRMEEREAEREKLECKKKLFLLKLLNYLKLNYLLQFSSFLVLEVFSRLKQTAPTTVRTNLSFCLLFWRLPFLTLLLSDSFARTFNFCSLALNSFSLVAADKRGYVRESTAGSCQWLLTVT